MSRSIQKKSGRFGSPQHQRRQPSRARAIIRIATTRAKACDRAELLARYQGAFEQAQYWISESLSIYRQLDDLHGMADSLTNLGYVALHQGNHPLALDYYNAALATHQQLDNQQGIADSYSHLALLAYQRGDFTRPGPYIGPAWISGTG